jgi:hypothetical protein
MTGAVVRISGRVFYEQTWMRSVEADLLLEAVFF